MNKNRKAFLLRSKNLCVSVCIYIYKFLNISIFLYFIMNAISDITDTFVVKNAITFLLD